MDRQAGGEFGHDGFLGAGDLGAQSLLELLRFCQRGDVDNGQPFDGTIPQSLGGQIDDAGPGLLAGAHPLQQVQPYSSASPADAARFPNSPAAGINTTRPMTAMTIR